METKDYINYLQALNEDERKAFIKELAHYMTFNGEELLNFETVRKLWMDCIEKMLSGLSPAGGDEVIHHHIKNHTDRQFPKTAALFRFTS